MNTQWVPLVNTTHYSLLESIQKAEQLAQRCNELGYDACGMTDSGNVSGVVDFIESMTEHNIKPLVGCEYTLDDLSHVTLYAKNLNGWENLVRLVSQSNQTDRVLFTRNNKATPTITLDLLRTYSNDLLAVTASHLQEEIRLIVGQNNFYSQNTKTDLSVGTFKSYYTKQSDAEDHRVVISSEYGETLNKLKNSEKIKLLGDDRFLTNDSYYVLNEDEANSRFTKEERLNTLRLADKVETFSIGGQPRLPKFSCPDGLTELEYLKKLCIEGWNKRLVAKNVFLTEQVKQTYRERVQKELGVIGKAGLQGYFLIVADYMKWAKSQGWLVGPGRGSAGGSLVAYLTEITLIDPIKYDLIFERFYNEGRNTPNRIALPDIDCDFPITKRELVIEYIRNKYGNDKVSQIATFGRMMGAGSLKAVLRATDACDNTQANVMTKNIPGKDKISDQLEAANEKSILNWVLDNEPAIVKDWCTKNDDGTLSGQFSTHFAQAIRLEATYVSCGRHPSGIVISPDILDDVCPMMYNEGKDKKTGLSMEALEGFGFLKMDILGIALLDKLMAVNDLLRFGKIQKG